SSKAVRFLSRVRTVTPEGPGTTNGAATLRNPPTPATPVARHQSDICHHPQRPPTGEGHAFDTRTFVPRHGECACQCPAAHSCVPEHAQSPSTTCSQPPASRPDGTIRHPVRTTARRGDR